MNTLKELLDAILRVFFGHNAIDNVQDWKKAHDKANASRAEIEKTIRESEESQ